MPQNLFNHTTRIKAINFDRNFITFVPSDAFNSMNIVHLVFSFNQIRSVDANAFVSLEESLEYLDFERNLLTTIPSAIYNLLKLRYLYLTSNLISNLDALPASVKVLSLSSNNFSRIPIEALSNCSLLYLNLGYNQITSIDPNTFVGGGWGAELQVTSLDVVVVVVFSLFR